MNKKCTPLRNVKLDNPPTMQAPFVITDEMKEAFHVIANETAEEYAKRMPGPTIIHPNVKVQCDGTACKSVRYDVETIMTDIKTINEKAKSIDESLKTISNDLGKQPCMKCTPKELSGFYFRGHHIRTGYIFGAFTWFILTLTIVTIDSCKQQSVAEINMELAIRWHSAYVECNHKYKQLIKEVKTKFQKKKSEKKDSRQSITHSQ